MSSQAGLQREAGAVLSGTVEDCRNRGRREGGRELDAMSQSATQA